MISSAEAEKQIYNALLLANIHFTAKSVHGPGYPAPLRTDIWHPALTEAREQGKGLVFLNSFPPLDLVKIVSF